MGAGAAQKPVARPRVNACARSYGRTGRMIQDTVRCIDTATDRAEQQPVNTAIQPMQKTKDQSESVVNHMMVNEPPDVPQCSENEFGLTRDNLPGHKVDEDEPRDPLLADGWSQLRYIDVSVEGLPNNVTALNDSGCQLCVIRADVMKPLALPKLGHAKLKGLSLEVVPADLVRIKIRMHEGTEFITITCAVVQNLNYQPILGSDIVDKLNRQLIDDKNESTEVMAVDISDDGMICDEDDDDAVTTTVMLTYVMILTLMSFVIKTTKFLVMMIILTLKRIQQKF